MSTVSYGHTCILADISYEEVLEKVSEALKEEGFGIMSEIDVKATMKKKLDKDFRNYKILGACNPPFAFQALSGEPLIGLLMPCNVVVFEEYDGTINVSAVKTTEMFKVVNNPQVGPIAEEVDARLVAALDRL